MQVIKQSACTISVIVASLSLGQTLVYPTETCYGLGCDATNAEAVKQIYAIKNRPEEKSLIVLAYDLDQMAEYIEITPALRNIEKKYWPGALTVVVPVKKGVHLPSGVVSESGEIAFRVTNHPFAREIVEIFGRPLVSTSANIGGEANPYDLETIVNTLGKQEIKPDIIIDAGTLPMNKPSTVVRLVGEKIEVLRQGEVVV